MSITHLTKETKGEKILTIGFNSMIFDVPKCYVDRLIEETKVFYREEKRKQVEELENHFREFPYMDWKTESICNIIRKYFPDLIKSDNVGCANNGGKE